MTRLTRAFGDSFGSWWDRPGRRPARRRSKLTRRSRTQREAALLTRSFIYEPLEDRLMLDIGGTNSLPPTIVVGRTLSAYDVPDVKNNQETLTFTVYNQAADPISGVLLTDTLESGVTFASASQLPDQNGQQLAWSLGTIQPYDRASVTLTVSLANPVPTQLDTGASAYGTLDAGMVTWTTAPATLRTTAVAADLLASTPDASTTDPYVQEKAAELNYDPTQIYSFLQTQIGYNSYTGSLRGARGTLWSSAGNALDDASLGVALMRASGIPAQYEQGTLSQSQAQQLILSMFPASYQTLGYVASGTQTSDPADDPTLLSETEQHYWFQFDAGSGMQDADPEFSGQSIGHAVTTASGTFAQVPDNFRQKTEVSLTAEIYNQALATFAPGSGSSFTDTEVLDQTFNDVDLVGHPLTVGTFVTGSGIAGLLSAATYTYQPFIDVADDAYPDGSHDGFISGKPFQESLTSFAFGSEVLTGLFLTITTLTHQPGGSLQSSSVQKTLVDRIGTAQRDSGSPASLDFNGSTSPALTNLDLTTIDITSAAQPETTVVRQREAVQNPIAELQALTGGSNADASSPAFQQAFSSTSRDILQNELAIAAASFLADSDDFSHSLSGRTLDVSYFSPPRIITVESSTQSNPTGDAPGVDLQFDILDNIRRVYAMPGNASNAAPAYQFDAGLADSLIEEFAMASMNPFGPADLQGSMSVFLAALANPAASIVTINDHNLPFLSQLPISDQARALITAEVQQGFTVFVPNRMVQIGGVSRLAWLEFDSARGGVISVSDDGAHEAISEGATDEVVAVEQSEPFRQGVKFAFKFLNKLNDSGGAKNFTPQQMKNLLRAASTLLNESGPSGGVVALGFFSVSDIFKLYLKYVPPSPADPPTAGLLVGPLTSPSLAASASGTVHAAPDRNSGATSGTTNVSLLEVAGNIAGSWQGNGDEHFMTSAFNVSSATVTNASGKPLGAGTVSAAAAEPLEIIVSGQNAYSVSGTGQLSFYGQAERSLGADGDWKNYTVSVTGSPTITVTVPADAIQLNGAALPAGTYTITSSSATLSGSGMTSAPNFVSSVSVTATNATVQLGPGSGNVSAGGTPISATETTLTGYSGTIHVVATGNGADAVTFNGNALNVLSLTPSSMTLTTDQNTPVSFQAGVNTSFADDYKLAANAPSGWNVTISDTGDVTIRPAPGTQSGTFPIQVIAQSTTNPNLISQATVEVIVTSTTTGMSLAVDPDPNFTVPFDNAQVPSAFLAAVQNLGPTADTYHLTFSTMPPGFALLNSGTSVTVPAGQTGILGLYLQPTGATLPPAGTQVNFTVTATSTADPSMTKTVTLTFTMPAIAAATVTSDPVELSATPGAATTATITITNVGNVPYDAALATTTDSGLTISGLSSPGMIPVGQSVTETATLTPDAGTPLNSTLNATVNVDQAATQSGAQVIAVGATSVGGAPSRHPSPLPEGEGDAVAGQTVDVSADLQSEVSAQEQGTASFTVVNSSGQTLFTSTAVPVTLATIGNLDTIDLGTFSTAGFAAGQYTITVSIDDSSGKPIAGASNTTTLTVSLPVSASLSVDTDNETPGPVTSTATLDVTSNAVIGNVATDTTAASVAVKGTLAYVAGTQDISVVDISDPTSPKVLGTFGSKDLNLGGETAFNLLGIGGNDLIVASQVATAATINFLVYSLANPQTPTLLGNASVPFDYLNGMTIEGTTAYLSTFGQTYDANGDVLSQTGELVAVDFRDPAMPVVGGALYNDQPQPAGHASFVNESAAANPQTLLVTGSTSTGANTQVGTGQVTVVNIGAGGALSAGARLTIPGTVQAVGIAVDGTHALVVGSTGGSVSPFSDPSQVGLSGNVTLTLLDITNPASPTVIGTTVVTQNTFQPVGAYPLGSVDVVALGNGQFAINGTLSDGLPTMLCVDASNPNSLATSNLATNASAAGLTLAVGELFGAGADGLTIYQPAARATTPVTVTATVPTNGVSIVANSFSVAPTNTTSGANSETLTWTLNLAPGANQQITWQTNIADLQAEQVQPVVTAANVQFTPPGSTPQNVGVTLNGSTLNVAGVPTPVGVTLPVEVAAPGVPAVANAAVAAQNLNIPGLSTQLNDLAIALTNLVQTPTSNVYLGQATAALASIITLVTNDPFLGTYTPSLTAAQTALSAATTAAEVQTAVTNLGTALDSLAQAITDYALHGFTLSLTSNQALALPGAPTLFNVQLQNTGTQTTTYDFSVSGLPAGVTAQVSRTSITLAPGQSIPQGTSVVTLTLSQSGGALVGGSFTVTAAAEGAPEITLSTQGQLTLLAESAAVPVVTVTPPFTQAGGQVDVTAKIQTVVNEPHTLSATFTVTDPNGKVIYTDPNPQTVPLTDTSGLTTVDLGNIDTTGFVNGVDTVTVTVTDVSPTGTVGAALPTASDQSTLTIGLPVMASVTTSPASMPAGFGDVTNTLSVNAETPFPDPLTLDGQVATTPAATDVALYPSGNKTYAYVAGTNGIDVVDVSNPAAPVDKGAFGTGDIVKGGVTIGRIATLAGTDYLIVGTTATLNANQFTLLIYSLANPLAPSKVSETAFDYEFMNDLLIDGTTLLVPTAGLGFFGGGLSDEYGTVLAIDLSNPPAPVLKGELYNNRGMPQGGNTQQIGGIVVQSGLAYITSSTETAAGGFTFNPGVGRVLVVDDSNPASLSVSKEVDIPGTEQALGVAIQGSQALVVSSTAGPTGNQSNYQQASGNLVLSLMDVGNPASPTLIGTTLITADTFGSSTSNGGAVSVLSLGNGLYAVSGTTSGGKPVLLLVDPTDPNNIVVSATTLPAPGNEMSVSGDILYATSSQGLTTYQIGTIAHTSYTASVEVPTDANTSIVSGSFNIPPTSITTGTNFDTLTWVRQLAFGQDQQTFTWQTQVKSLGAGEVRPVTLGTSVPFVSQSTPGSLSLPATSVTGTPIAEVFPSSQTAVPGGTLTYDLRLINPLNETVDYYLQAEFGFNETNTLPAVVRLQPDSTVDVPFQITSNVGTPPAKYNMEIVVNGFLPPGDEGPSGESAVATFTATLAGTPVIPAPDAHGVSVTITPAKASVGPDDLATYTVQLTNTGSVDDTFSLSQAGTAGLLNAYFSKNNIEVPPGASNFRDVTLTLQPDVVSPPGDLPFSVTATSINDSSVKATANATLTILPLGVFVLLTSSTSSTAPGAPYHVVVENAGQTTDTFNLSLAGPAAQIASLASQTVTLAPGADQNIDITTSAADFADAGNLPLTVVATSQTDPVVQGASTANLTVPSTQSVAASFNPPTQNLSAPGAASFLLQVNNTGNTEDSYSATITGTNGPITASLIGLDGKPAQSVPLFILPGLAQGAILLDVSGATPGQGTVTVTIQSLTNSSESATATATLNVASPVQMQLAMTANSGLTAVEGTTTPVTGSMLTAAVPNGNTPATGIVYTVTAVPTSGSLLLNGQALAAGGTFTQDDINNGRLTYHSTEEGADSFGFSVAGTNALGTTGTFQLAASDAPVTPTGGFTYSAAQGSAATAQTVATFTDPGGVEALADYSATMDWGDGTSASTGSISNDTNTHLFTVAGKHTYAEEGTFTVKVTLTHETAPNVTATSSAEIAVATVTGSGGIVATAVTVTGYEDGAATSIPVATFTDGAGALPAGDFGSAIDWGDGNSSTGSLSLSSGTYTVAGAHEYLDEGSYTVTVGISQTAGPTTGGATTAIASAKATIHEQLLANGATGTADQNWIQEIYRDLFARQAEIPGLDYWVAELARGASRSEVAHQMIQIASFEEFQHDTVATLYQQYLGRAPDPAGEAYWSAYLYNGGTIETMSRALVGSSEYYDVRGGGTADGFLNALFQDALGRTIDQAALAYFAGQMGNGASASEVAAAVFGSDEYHRARVNGLFEQFLRRPADPAALAFFAGELNDGLTDEYVITQLISSDEYYDRVAV